MQTHCLQTHAALCPRDASAAARCTSSCPGCLRGRGPEAQQLPRQRWLLSGGSRRSPASREQHVPRSFADVDGPEGRDLTAAFDCLVNERGLQSPLRTRRPSPLLAPGAAVAAQLDALQRNDWPEPDAGIRTAFEFAQPRDCEQAAAAGPRRLARSWGAEEAWLSWAEFSDHVHAAPYGTLVSCDSWQAASPVVFPSERHPDRAVQAVAVQAAGGGGGRTRAPQAFTFCLQLAQRGPYKGCWLTVGVRVGDYAH